MISIFTANKNVFNLPALLGKRVLLFSSLIAEFAELNSVFASVAHIPSRIKSNDARAKGRKMQQQREAEENRNKCKTETWKLRTELRLGGRGAREKGRSSEGRRRKEIYVYIAFCNLPYSRSPVLPEIIIMEKLTYVWGLRCEREDLPAPHPSSALDHEKRAKHRVAGRRMQRAPNTEKNVGEENEKRYSAQPFCCIEEFRCSEVLKF